MNVSKKMDLFIKISIDIYIFGKKKLKEDYGTDIKLSRMVE